MRVGLDISAALTRRPTGVARYIERLAGELNPLPEVESLELFCRLSKLKYPERLLSWDTPDLKVLTGIPWLDHPQFERAALDLYHAPDLRLPAVALSCPIVVTIHDLAALERDDHASSRFLEQKREQYREAVARARVIVTHSSGVRTRVAGSLEVDPDCIRAVPLASGLGGLTPDRWRPVAKTPQTLLSVGGPSVRKGSDRILKLYEVWRQLGWQPEIDWVGDGDRDLAQELANGMATLGGQLRFHGLVSDAELSQLYANSDGVLLLSTTEGFAMPLLEAAIHGCPILAADSEIAREVIREGAIYFGAEPLEPSQEFLRPNVREYLRHTAYKVSSDFSWKRTATETCRAYRLALV